MNRTLYCVLMRSHHPSSPIIRAATWSAWSHVAPVTQSGVVYDCTCKTGVVRTTVPRLLARASKFQFGYLPVTAGAERLLEAQVGKPYDWTALPGIWLHRDWQRDDRWFCAELEAAACASGGSPVIYKPTGRVTPNDIYTSPVMRWFPAGVIPAIFQ